MPRQSELISRAAFVGRASGFLAVVVFGRANPLRGAELVGAPEHPEPRPGITGERVLTAEALGKSVNEKVLAAFDAARAYPALFDGIACGCGCSGSHGDHRSLLVCYETRQPTGCWGCRESANLVARLAKEDRTLAEIRQAIDRQNGG
jgi:hypothetical protein